MDSNVFIILHEWACLVYIGAWIEAVNIVTHTVTALILLLSLHIITYIVDGYCIYSFLRTNIVLSNLEERKHSWTNSTLNSLPITARRGEMFVTLRHRTKPRLPSTELASILPAESNGKASGNLYYYSKVIELPRRVCVGLELPCIFFFLPSPILCLLYIQLTAE